MPKFIKRNKSQLEETPYEIGLRMGATNLLMQLVDNDKRMLRSLLFDNRISDHQSVPKAELLAYKKWLTTKEAATYLGKSVAAVRNLVHRGLLASYKPSWRLYFKRTDLDRWIETSRKGGF